MRKIIIIGASKGLGQASAIWFSKLNYKIVLLSRSKSSLEKVRKQCKNSNKHLCLELDLFKINDIEKSIKKALKFLNGVDVILHAAGGGLGIHQNLVKHDDFQKVLQLNLLSAAEVNRVIVPYMKKKKNGNIVHIGSIASYENAGYLAYNSSKAALSAYVRSLGRDLASFNVIVTGILPGGFLAPQNAMERLKNRKNHIFKKIIKERLPRNKMGKVEEILPIIEFLCSRNAGMMSACLVPADAGEGKSYNFN
jgi:3-oxoacyl-[acyl-carrier protein] reductase